MILLLILNIYPYSAKITDKDVTVGGVTCPITTDYKGEASILSIEEVKAGILIVNYDQNAENGTSCMYSEQWATIVNLKKNACLGNFLRKNINHTKENPDCDIAQPKWDVSKKAIVVYDDYGEEIANIKL